MSHPYDASTKYLLDVHLADWLSLIEALIGRKITAPVQIIDADLSTVTAAADKLLLIEETTPWLMHVELQASRDPDLEYNLPAYNVLAARRHKMRVRTVLVLLRRADDDPQWTGLLEKAFPGEAPYFMLRFWVLRIWEHPPEVFLEGPVWLMPLAPLSAVSKTELPGVIARMDQRIRREVKIAEAGPLWTVTRVLMGLEYKVDFIARLLQGVHGMRESVTYQAIVEEGRVEALQDVLLSQGGKKFGAPDETIVAKVRGITELDHLKFLSDRLLDVSSWEELFKPA